VGRDRSVAHGVTGLSQLTGGPEKKKIISGFSLFPYTEIEFGPGKIVRVLWKNLENSYR
jgi:hypothetical protein